MSYEVEEAARARLDEVAAAAPPVGFTAADVVRRGRRRRQVRRGALAGAAAAALALVVAVPTVALRGTGGAGTVDAAAPVRTTPPPTRSPGPVRTTPPALAVPAVPGLTAEEARRIASACTQFGGVRSPDAHVRSIVRDALGTHAVVYGAEDFLSCDVRPGGKVIAGTVMSGTSLRWLPGHLAVDNLGATPGGPAHSGPGVPDTRGYDLVEGRVSASVATVAVRIDGERVVVRAVNGTFALRIVHSLGWEPPARDRGISVEALAADGRRLARISYGPGPTGCYVAPDGTILTDKTQRKTNCRPAVAWP